jgi:hypothetical protein
LILCCRNPLFAAQRFDKITIKDVIVNMDTGIHFRIIESMDYDENCGSNAWFKIEPDSSYEKEALALLLAYQAQSEPVTVYISGCTSGYPKLNYIY